MKLTQSCLKTAMHDEIIDSTQCAALLRCTAEQIEELARAGELPALKHGRSWIFMRTDLLVFLAQKARDEARERRLKPRAKPTVPDAAAAPKAKPLAISTEIKTVAHLVDASEAARLLAMGTSTFWREVKNGNLPQSVKIAGMTRWRVADIRIYVESMDRRGGPES